MSLFRVFVVGAVLFSVPQTLGAIGPVADLVISNVYIQPDGYNRSTVLAGGTFPGPVITATKGDQFEINVINELTDSTMRRSTTVHWHGLFQAGTNWADGVQQVNQCPIAPTNSFLYSFSATTQTGTYWYHSHLATQYCDGLRGALVIYDPEDPYANLYDVDDETTIITLADWYHTPAPSAGAFPTPDSTLINGLGRYAGGPSSDISVITVEQGKRYRFRLLALVCHPNYVFSIDSHTFTVIEADGVATEPLVVDSVKIFAAQRYSIIMTANQTVDNYWIRANPNMGSTGFDGGINSAILSYFGANSSVEPTSNDTSSNPLYEPDLHALTDPAAPGIPEVGGADVLLNLDLSFTSNLTYDINGYSWTYPTVPVLLQILSGAVQATDLLPTGSVYTLPSNKVIELSIPGGVVGGPHPFHLHGHTFSVVRSANSTTYNYANPVRRDTVSIGSYTTDNTTIRFTTDNPGPWILHCHIDWHLEAGLAIVFAEAVNQTAAANNPSIPEAWRELCPIYDALPSDLQ